MWKFFKYGFVFLFSCFVLVFFSSINSYDSIWNYSFSYAISRFQVPFLEINMITPGLYSMVMSLGLFFCHNNLVYLLEQAFLITLTFYFLDKLFSSNAWLFLFFLSFPSFVAFAPTYNYFLLFLTIVVIYLEKSQKSDLLIGVVLGCLLLTKHTVGVFLLLPSIIFYFREKKKLFHRFLGIIIPCSIYLLFLIITGSFFSFFDLCILGLFDFFSHNKEIVFGYFIFSIAGLFLTIIYIVKKPKDILGYYVLFFFSLLFPIFSHYHFYLYFVTVSLLLMSSVTFPKNYIRNLSLVLSFLVVFVNFSFQVNDYAFLGVHNFDFLYLPKDSSEQFHHLDKLYSKYQKKGKAQILSSKNPWIKISREEDVDYFNVFLEGNFGYRGNEKMIEKIKDVGNCYYILDRNEYDRACQYGEQFDVFLSDYIIEHAKLVEEKDGYEVYYYEGVV